MKFIKYNIAIITLLLCLSSCNYLDIVPDEISTEADAFKTTKAAEGFLYSCYGYLPQPNNGTSSIDFFTGDEVVTAFEHETFANFPKGNFTAAAPVISYWNTLFQGIRQCYILKNNINTVPNLPDSVRDDYVAQADFLIAYYHFLLLRSYGPIILIKKEPELDTPAEKFLPRTNYDECVKWITSKFDEAAKGLPEKRIGEKYGLATSLAAKGIKARMLLYAASPLFNGNSEFYSNFVDKEGKPLMNLNYDAGKWEKAKVACKEAIDASEAAGYKLYTSSDAVFGDLPEPADPTQRALRFTLVDKASPEIIWADTRKEGNYGLQNKSRPIWSGCSWNGIAPTLPMLDRFYTKNGLPIDIDPNFNYNDRYKVKSFEASDNLIRGEGKTQIMNTYREPRYYAWISFHGGYYECMGSAEPNNNNNQIKNPYLPKYKRGIEDAKLITYFTKNDNCGKADRNNNYSPTGFLNKKGVHPASSSSGSLQQPYNYPWSNLRLGELYLDYAEACVETGDLANAKIYINKIRERAGIPSVDDSWSIVGIVPDQSKMRDIVRQERMIELYLENQNFWDMRRWKLAEQYFNTTVIGMGINENVFEQFANPIGLSIIRKFSSPAQYLMPIPSGEINKNTKLVQNPGY